MAQQSSHVLCIDVLGGFVTWRKYPRSSLLRCTTTQRESLIFSPRFILYYRLTFDYDSNALDH
jgi:hypothetical protein